MVIHPCESPSSITRAINPCTSYRLINLPKDVLHHIFSYFNDTEMSNLMNTSKELRNICMSSSFMTFAAYLHHPSTTALDFRNSIDDFLWKASLQHTTPLVKVLCLTWRRGKQGRRLNCSQALPQSWFLLCVHTLVLRFFKIELLESSKFGDWISSNCFVYVRKLVLHLDNCSFGPKQTLSIEHCPMLEEIQVSGPDNTPYDHDFRLKISCWNLERLTIKNFIFEDATCEISIMGEQLQMLHIDGVMFLNCSSLGHCFKIHAPNLQVFHWSGSPIQNFKDSKSSFQILEKVVLDVKGKHETLYYEFLNKILSSIQHAVHLEWCPLTRKVYGFNKFGFIV